MKPTFSVSFQIPFRNFTFKRHSVEYARIVKYTEIGKHDLHFQILYSSDNFHLLQKSAIINIALDRESNSLQGLY